MAGLARAIAGVMAGGMLVAAGALWYLFDLPGRGFQGPVPPPTVMEQALAARLRRHVEQLAGTIGGRSVLRPDALEQAARYMEAELRRTGRESRAQPFPALGMTVRNIELELPGTRQPEEIVVIGAHYDTVGDQPGANDNASGAAALLELAYLLRESRPERTLRFVAFVNEEPPFFQGDLMGSVVYARRCRARNERITAMLSIETIGYYTDEPDTQRYPVGLHLGFPATGNFVGFTSNLASRGLLRQVVRTFRRHTALPSEGAALPGHVTGVGWSDHWAFWQQGYPALMVTDTASYRYPYHHTRADTPDKLRYERMARVVLGLDAVIGQLTSPR